MADLTGFMPEETGAEQVRVETFFKPNLDLIASALGARQQRYNTNLDTMAKVKAKIDEVNSLEGYDRDEWFKMQEEYDKNIAELMSLYEGDLSKASGELQVFTSKVGKDFGVHGKATAINERALGYMANKKELDTRLQEGKIENEQYWRLGQELEATKNIGIGTDAKAYRGWRKITPMDAVKFDKFANEFLKNVNSSYQEQDYIKTVDPNGFVIWKKEGHETIKYEDVLKELNRAYRSEAEKTGQLLDSFDYHIHKNKINMNGEVYVKKYTDLANATDQELKLLSIEKPNEDQVKEIQNLINRYAENKVQVDGIIGDDDNQYIKLLKPALEERKKNYSKSADDIKIMNSDELRNYYYGDYTESELTKKADPYARAKSKHDIKRFMEIRADPIFEFNLRVRQDQLKVDYEKAIKNTLPLINTSEGIDLLSPSQVTDLNKALSGLEQEKKDLEAEVNAALDNKEMVKYNTLKEKLSGLNSRILNINQAMSNIDTKMEKNGMKTNGQLIDEKLNYYLNGFGGGWLLDNHEELVNYHTMHTAFLSAMTPEQRKAKFNTDDVVKIKNKYAGKPEEMKKLNSEIAKYYKDNPDKLKVANNWIKTNLNNTDVHSSYEKVYPGVPMRGSKVAVAQNDPIKNLATSIAANTTNYIEKSKDNIFTQSTEFFVSADKDSRVGQLQQSLANALKSNAAGFYDINDTQATLSKSKETFTNEKGEKVTGYDLTKISPEEIAIAQKSLYGNMYIKVPLKDTQGKQLYRTRKDGTKEAATIIIRPANTASYYDAYHKTMLENINTIKKLATTDLSGYSTDKLNELNEGERIQLLGAYSNDYQNALGALASANFLSVLEKQDVYKIPTGSAKQVNISGQDVLLIHGTPKYNSDGSFKGYSNEDVWSITTDYEFLRSTNKTGFIPKGSTKTFVTPNLFTSITGSNVQLQSQFPTVYELSKALEFNFNNHFPIIKK
jgi:hypothetical protein